MKRPSRSTYVAGIYPLVGNFPTEVIRVANSEKLLRLLKMIALIERRSGASLSQIMEDCNVCARTVYRDLEALAESGLSVYFDPDCKRYRFMEKVFLKPLTFSVEEASALLASIEDLSGKQSPLGGSLRLAREKILDSLTSERQGQVDKARRAVDIRVAASAAGLCQTTFSCIEQAAEECRRLEIRYYTKTSESQSVRKVDPYVITFRGGSWYLIAFCHVRQDVITFRMDRVQEAKELSESFVLPVDFSVESYFGGSWYIERGEPIAVKLRFSPEAARWVRETQYHPSQVVTVQSDGSILFAATVNGRREITRWILGYGAAVEVLEPVELREYVADQAKAMMGLYGL